MPHIKLSKKSFWDKFFEKQSKIATHMDLWKYGQILNHSKVLSSETIKVFKEKILHMSLSSLSYYIESQ
jgi:hypothetical protein